MKNYHPAMNNKLFGNQILFLISSIDIVCLFSFLRKIMKSYAGFPPHNTTTKILSENKINEGPT